MRRKGDKVQNAGPKIPVLSVLFCERDLSHGSHHHILSEMWMSEIEASLSRSEYLRLLLHPHLRQDMRSPTEN